MRLLAFAQTCHSLQYILIQYVSRLTFMVLTARRSKLSGIILNFGNTRELPASDQIKMSYQVN